MSKISAALLLALSAFLVGLTNLCVRFAVGRVQHEGSSLAFVLGVIRQPVFVAGLILFGAASVLWFRVLTAIGLSTAYPVFVSLTYLVVAIGAVYLFDERLSAAKLVGTALLIAGIFFISRG